MTQTQDATSPQSCATAGSDVAEAPVTVHVTGFEHFDRASFITPWDAVRLLPEIIELAGSSATPTRELLPAASNGASAASRNAIERLRPDVVVHVGLQTQKMAPERTPRNDAAVCISGDIGFQASGEDSVSGEMPQCRAAWTTAALAGRLRAAGLPVTYTAGAEQYAEMATNYAALDAVSDMAEGSRPVVGLVHVPDQEIMSSPTVAEVLRAFIVELADVVRRRRAAVAGLGRLSVPRGNRALRVGLTGGIGSGKSTVAGLLAARDAHIVDADVIAREVVEPGTPGFDAIIAAFGAELLTADGALDRALLAERVFNDPDARGTLEAIMLPQVAQTAAQRMEAAAPGGVAVYDVPLLVEEGMEDLFDCVMVVETPRALRLARLQRRGLTREDAESRIASQAGDEERRQVADIVLLNNGTREDLADGVEWLWTNRIAVN